MEQNIFHVPQQSIRHKLRLTPQNDDDVLVDDQFPLLLSPNNNNNNNNNNNHETTSSSVVGGLNLSLSTYARSVGAYGATPVGPFTGYASILGRSRFLKPAQELLEDFCGGGNSSFQKENMSSKLLEDSGSSWFGDDEDISRRCNNPTLLSMLHEVYKRYKLYCQQMHSAVTSFESVAGLGNAAPFVSFAIRAMFRHFHCLKNAILDHIRVTGKVFGNMDLKRGCSSASCSENKGRGGEQKQVVDPNFLQHPVWRSQRGFPDKAVAVLRTWLFEHFLHPYPSDSDKQMLAQKTGLSRSQVSNWFTNARVRLWKPMVEEMHALERKTQCSKDGNTSKFVESNDQIFSMHQHLPQKGFQFHMNRDQESHSKRCRIEELPRMEPSKDPFTIPCNQLQSNQTIDIGGSHNGRQVSHGLVLGSNQDTTTGLSWSTPAQIVPFWLAKQ